MSAGADQQVPGKSVAVRKSLLACHPHHGNRCQGVVVVAVEVALHYENHPLVKCCQSDQLWEEKLGSLKELLHWVVARCQVAVCIEAAASIALQEYDGLKCSEVVNLDVCTLAVLDCLVQVQVVQVLVVVLGVKESEKNQFLELQMMMAEHSFVKMAPYFAEEIAVLVLQVIPAYRLAQTVKAAASWQDEESCLKHLDTVD